MSTARLGALATAAVLALAPRAARSELAPPGSSPEQELVSYVVQQGDTCEAIAERLYGHRRFYYVIAEREAAAPNILRTTCDRSLRPGQTLSLPRRIPASRLDPDAQVTAVVNTVRSRGPEAPRWDEAQPGQGLYRGWRVNTLERSEAELDFRDESSLHLREETLVIIFGPTAGEARRRTSKATLEKGTLRARLGELSGRNKLDLLTPTARALLSGGEALVSVDAEETSRLSNHSGRPAKVMARKGGDPVLVSAGMGTTVRRDKAPTPPTQLLDPPRWTPDQPAIFLTIDGLAPAVVTGSWHTVRGATRFHVELSGGPAGSGPIGAVEVPPEVHRFELRGLAPGTYSATVSALDAQGLESAPSTARVVRVLPLRLRAPPFASAEQPAATSGGPPSALAGSRLLAPEGLRCAIGGAELAREVVLSGQGLVTLTCQDAIGRNAPRLQLDVRPLPLSLRSSERDAPLEQLRRGERRALRLEGVLAARVPLRELAAVGGPGLRVDGLERSEDGALLLTVSAELEAPLESYVELQLRPTGGRRAVLGRVRLGLDAPLPTGDGAQEDSPPTARPQPRPLTEGASLLGDERAFGVRDEQRAGSGLIAAGRLAFGDDGSIEGRGSFGLRLAFFSELLRLDLAVPVAQVERRGGLTLALSSRVLGGETLGLAVGLSTWVPLGHDAEGDRFSLRLVPSLDLSLRRGRLCGRTRQGLLADAAQGGLLAWAGAYALDVWIAGPLTLGTEVTLLLGAEGGQRLVSPTAGLGLGLDLGLVALTLSGQVSLTDAAAEALGRASIVLALRAQDRGGSNRRRRSLSPRSETSSRRAISSTSPPVASQASRSSSSSRSAALRIAPH